MRKLRAKDVEREMVSLRSVQSRARCLSVSVQKALNLALTALTFLVITYSPLRIRRRSFHIT